MLIEELAAPTVFPVSLASAKAWAREPSTGNDWDVDYTDLLQSAVMQAETISHNRIVYRPLRERFDCFWPLMELSGYPVRGISSITYLDTAGAQQTLSPSTYRLDIFAGRARLTPEYGQFFPPVRPVVNAVTVTYDSGLLVPITSVDTGTNTLTAPGHNKAAGDTVQLSTDGGALPGGLTAGRVYYALNPSGDTLQLAATSGGSAIALSVGYLAPAFIGALDPRFRQALRLLINGWMNFSSAITAENLKELPVPMGVEALLSQFQPRGF